MNSIFPLLLLQYSNLATANKAPPAHKFAVNLKLHGKQTALEW